MKLTIGERIRSVRMLYDLTTKKMAETLGVKEYKIKDMERGKQKTPGDILELIVEHFSVNCRWLLTGEGEINEVEDNSNVRPAHILENTNKVSNVRTAHILGDANKDSNVRPAHILDNSNNSLLNDFILVPRYDVHASAGHGSIISSEQIVDHLAFKRDWVRKDLGLNPDKLALINAVGDSMEPAILSNDLLLVDLDSNTLTDDAIYVISVNDSLLVKRIQTMLDGTVKIKSDNPIYDNQTLKKEELSDLRVLGRVVWFGRYM